MDGRFISRTSTNHHEQEDSENSPENSADSPRFGMSGDSKAACTSSPRKSGKRSIQKRVVSVPIKDVEGSRLRGEMGAPPSDSWAWRKYGQKPIKGSPYPRGYYRCSSSKGCPARKQVERSRNDPNILLVTYSCEHNHPGPAARNQNHHNQISPNSTKASKIARRDVTTVTKSTNSDEEEDEEEEEEEEEEEKPTKLASEAALVNQCDNIEKFVTNISDGTSLMSSANDNVWFPEFDCSISSTMLHSPTLTEDRVTDDEIMRMAFTIRDDDESFFADLGELPECSKVFGRGMMERDDERRRLNLTPWCGTTG